jgi:hypothetical protein
MGAKSAATKGAQGWGPQEIAGPGGRCWFTRSWGALARTTAGATLVSPSRSVRRGFWQVRDVCQEGSSFEGGVLASDDSLPLQRFDSLQRLAQGRGRLRFAPPTPARRCTGVDLANVFEQCPLGFAELVAQRPRHEDVGCREVETAVGLLLGEDPPEAEKPTRSPIPKLSR